MSRGDHDTHANMDLEAYFSRIAFPGPAHADLETLTELHLRHPLAIPFENLSTLMREPVRLDLPSLQQKLIVAGRGGYCFEQNRLFAAVLEAIGFRVVPLAARVVWNLSPERVNPRTHMVLLVELGEDVYLSDVGFGGVTLTSPLRLVAGVEQQTRHERFRLVESGRELELQVELQTGWRPMYQFDLQPQLPIDFEVLNHYVSTHPSSHFLTTLMAARPTTSGRYSLANTELTIFDQGRIGERRSLERIDELADALSSLFEIRLPEGSALEESLRGVLDRRPG